MRSYSTIVKRNSDLVISHICEQIIKKAIDLFVKVSHNPH